MTHITAFAPSVQNSTQEKKKAKTVLALWTSDPVWPMDQTLRTTDLVVLLHEEQDAQKSCAISQISPLQDIYTHPFRRIRAGWEFPTHCSFCYIAHNFFFFREVGGGLCHSMRDLSSLIRDHTPAPGSGSRKP